MEEYISYLKKFQIAVLIVVLAFAGVVFLVMRTIPEIQNIMDNQANYTTQLDALAESERRMADVSANLE
ncbi:hypothetical protein J6P92_07140 [bacterium]|nr:hypothetical protein [bacterium]